MLAETIFAHASPDKRAFVLDLLANLEARAGDHARAVRRMEEEVEPLLDGIGAGQAESVRGRRAQWLDELGRHDEAQALRAEVAPRLRALGLDVMPEVDTAARDE